MKETRAAFARRLGVHKSWVTRAGQAGRLVMSDGLVDVEASQRRLAETGGTRPDVAARHAAARRDSAAPADTRRAPVADLEAGEPAAGKSRYRGIALHYENAGIKLEMALRSGRVHPLPAVKREALAIGATLRSALERLVDQTAPRLAVMNRPEDRAALIAEQIRVVRRTVRGEFPRALRRIRTAARGAQ